MPGPIQEKASVGTRGMPTKSEFGVVRTNFEWTAGSWQPTGVKGCCNSIIEAAAAINLSSSMRSRTIQN